MDSSLADRAAAIAVAARARDTSDRERIQLENAALFAWRQQFVDTFGAVPTYMTEFATGRTWGKTAEQRAKAEGGLGIAVQASVGPKRKERKRANGR